MVHRAWGSAPCDWIMFSQWGRFVSLMTKSYSALSNTRLHSAELMSNILHVQHRKLPTGHPCPSLDVTIHPNPSLEAQPQIQSLQLSLTFHPPRIDLLFKVVRLHLPTNSERKNWRCIKFGFRVILSYRNGYPQETLQLFSWLLAVDVRDENNQ